MIQVQTQQQYKQKAKQMIISMFNTNWECDMIL